MISKRVLILAVALLAVSSVAMAATVNSGYISVQQINIDPTSQLTFTQNGSYGIVTVTPWSTVEPYIHSGFAGAHWNGLGINSSAAAADFSANGILTLASFSGADALNILNKNNFHGHTIATTDTLIQGTYYGDTNLDGIVNDFDYGNVDSAYFLNSIGAGIPDPGSINGDFNHDGVVNDFDYGYIDSAYFLHSIGVDYGVIDTGLTHTAAGSAAAVPEPSTIGLLLAGCAVALFAYLRKR